MRTKQGLARGKVIAYALAVCTFLLLSAHQAQAALLFMEDGARANDQGLAGQWTDLALPGTAEGAVDSWYGGRTDSQTTQAGPSGPGGFGEFAIGMDEQGLGYGSVDKLTVRPYSGGLVDPVPEPASLMLLGGGLLALAAGRARRKSS